MQVRSAAPLSVLVALCLLGSCKRAAVQAPSVHRAPPASGPSAEDIAQEKINERLKALIPVPILGDGVIFKDPSGEVWTKYASGIMTHDIEPKPGAAKPGFGQTVTITYQAMFPGGGPGHETVFDHSEPDAPMVFELGKKEVLRGLNMGIAGMSAGSRRRIYIPPDLAYGAEGKLPTVLPNQALIYDVKLLSISGQGLDPPVPVMPLNDPIGPKAPPGVTPPASAPAP